MSAVAAAYPPAVRVGRIPERRQPRIDPRFLRRRADVAPDQGVLALAPPRPGSAPVPLADDDDFGPRPTSTRDLPEARRWAGLIGLTMFQVAVGVRPAPQVQRHVDPEVYESLVRRQVSALRRRTAVRRPARVRRVVTSEPRDGVVEASVVIEDGHRTRALALRLAGRDGRWLVTAVEIG